MATSRIVEAVGVSANSSDPARKSRAQAIEKAMAAAVTQCYADGITDPVKMRARMMAARQTVLDDVKPEGDG